MFQILWALPLNSYDLTKPLLEVSFSFTRSQGTNHWRAECRCPVQPPQTTTTTTAITTTSATVVAAISQFFCWIRGSCEVVVVAAVAVVVAAVVVVVAMAGSSICRTYFFPICFIIWTFIPFVFIAWLVFFSGTRIRSQSAANSILIDGSTQFRSITWSTWYWNYFGAFVFQPRTEVVKKIRPEAIFWWTTEFK